MGLQQIVRLTFDNESFKELSLVRDLNYDWSKIKIEVIHRSEGGDNEPVEKVINSTTLQKLFGD